MTSVLLDAVALSGAGGDRGVGTYINQLLANLASRGDIEVRVLCRPGTVIPAGVERVEVRRARPGRFQFAEHDLRLPIELLRHPSDVFHGPAATPPVACRRPWVETIFDLIPLTHGNDELRNERRRWRRVGARMRRADALIATSSYTASEAIKLLDVDPQRVYVAHLAAAPEFSPPIDRSSAARTSLLFVGGSEKRKRLDHAMAVASLVRDAGFEHRLRVCGPSGLVPTTVDRDHVEVAGRVNDIAAEYRRAAVLLVTSAAEGFGLPAVEAMACGTPVVAYANTATTEVVGTGGALVPDGDIAAMASAVTELLESEPRWAEASERALARASAFDWRRCAEIHADVYRDVAAKAS